MNADVIKELVKTVRLDWKVMSNPFRWLWSTAKGYDVLSAANEGEAQPLSILALKDLAVAYDAWLDLWPDTWDEGPRPLVKGFPIGPQRFPTVLDDFIPFAQTVSKLLALGKVSTALEVSNLIRGTTSIPWDDTGSWSNFYHLVNDLVAEHEQALEDLQNSEVHEQIEEMRQNRGC